MCENNWNSEIENQKPHYAPHTHTHTHTQSLSVFHSFGFFLPINIIIRQHLYPWIWRIVREEDGERIGAGGIPSVVDANRFSLQSMHHSLQVPLRQSPQAHSHRTLLDWSLPQLHPFLQVRPLFFLYSYYFFGCLISNFFFLSFLAYPFVHFVQQWLILFSFK